MGGNNSKSSIISYEDAVKRISDAELRRIKEAFRKSTGTNINFLSKSAFVQEVLCEGTPSNLADIIFTSCGGTNKGINFKDLISALVLITRGTQDEKIRFLWALYSNDSNQLIIKNDFYKALQNEAIYHNKKTDADHQKINTLSLFGSSLSSVTFDQFRSWILMHKDSTIFSKWLLLDSAISLSSELETPTFYQSLAGVTHLEEGDICDLEKTFWQLKNFSLTGQLDIETLQHLLTPPLPKAILKGFFAAFDENCDGHIDFKELCCGISMATRGPDVERAKFCFKIFEFDRDGKLNSKEVENMITLMLAIAKDCSTTKAFKSLTYEQVMSDLQDFIVKNKMWCNNKDTSKELLLSQEDFLMWCVQSKVNITQPFLDLLFEVCHIVFGLRPQCKHLEFHIVKGWISREIRRGYEVGQFWYLISSDWWQNWLLFTQSNNQVSPCTYCKSIVRLADEGNEEAAGGEDRWLPSASIESFSNNMEVGDSSSLGSGSSGISFNKHSPGIIDNSSLLAVNPYKAVPSLTGEGGRLKKEVPLVQHRDFELVPEVIWKALSSWYGGVLALPRQVVKPLNADDKEIELFPLNLRVLRHQQQQQQQNPMTSAASAHSSTWNTISSGYGALSNAGYSSVVSSNSIQAPKRYMAYTAAFSRLATIRQVAEFLCIRLKLKQDTIRLWHITQNSEIPYLLEDESLALEELEFADNDQILLELRNKDLTWPEEIRAISQNQNLLHDRRGTIASVQSFHAAGACGLHNLGNTCFMNAALQVLFNTKPLTEYFKQNIHLFELNTQNKMSTKGHLTLRYAELLKEILGSQTRSIAPIKFRFVVSKYAPQFTNGMQHDSQELLDWLLDTLHEDLNRVTEKPYVEIKDSNGRSDQLVAMEAYEGFLKRNNSIIVDLFYGQMKSKVTCETCSMESVRFEPFSLLSLPLPVENYVMCEVLVIKLDGSCPTRYGLRLNSECKYWDLKNQLSPLCNLEPLSILLCQIDNSQIRCVFSNEQKINPASSLTLYGYELPRKFEHSESLDQQNSKDIQRNKENQIAPLSNGDVAKSQTDSQSQKVKHSLDMMGTSPMNSFMPTSLEAVNMTTLGMNGDTISNEYASKTTTLTKTQPKVNGYANSNNGYDYDDDSISISSTRDSSRLKNYGDQHDYLIAIHRKFTRQDTYFLSYHKCKPSLFGVPLLIPLHDEMENKDLYCNVWQQISRLLSPLPVASRDQANHAEDCDDSMGYDFPFVLSIVKENGLVCALCPWEKFCRGCNVPCNEKQFFQEIYGSNLDSDSSVMSDYQQNTMMRNSIFLCIDWDTSALHLRYQSSREKKFNEHESIAICRKLIAEPVDLNHCLRAFTSEEKLDEHIHCSNCKSKQPATKKLQLWKLPPILIIHLKRFNFVNNKWVKSQKVVNFPFDNFDPTHFLASVPQETILRHNELMELKAKNIKNFDCNDEITEFDLENDITNGETSNTKREHKINGQSPRNEKPPPPPSSSKEAHNSINSTGRKRLVSTSLTKTPVVDSELVDYNTHKLVKNGDPFDLKYKLYAVVSHSGGMLSGGHYIAYASNQNKSWYCFNDSSCREIPSSQPNIDPSSAYLLFYERKNLDYLPYLPKIENKQPMLNQPTEILEESDNDLKKMCLLS